MELNFLLSFIFDSKSFTSGFAMRATSQPKIKGSIRAIALGKNLMAKRTPRPQSKMFTVYFVYFKRYACIL